MAGEPEVKLFSQRFSVFAHSVQIALKEKEIPFELVDVNLSDKPQDLLDANPIHKSVPAIIHKGQPVVESLIILEYLEDAFPENVPLRPKDAFEKSQVRFWTDYINKSFVKFSKGFRANPGSPEKAAAQELKMTFVETLNAGMTSFSPEGPFFTGDKFTLIDAVLAPLCSTLGFVGKSSGGEVPGPDTLPRLSKWVEAVKVRPSVASTVPSIEDYAVYMRRWL